jgi:hypothetical protein
MKGFGGITLAFAIAVAAALLLSVNVTTINSYSYKEIVPEAKQTISNFELVLNHAAEDCNWSLGVAQVQNCIDSNANAILARMNKTNGVKCTKLNNAIPESDLNTFKFDINCAIGTIVGSRSQVNLRTSQKIFIGKTNKYHELKTTDPMFSGVVGLWHLNGDGIDYSGNERNARLINATQTTDRNQNPNAAYSFDKTQGIFINKPFATGVIGTKATILVWAKMQNTGAAVKAPIIDFYSNTAGAHGATITQKSSTKMTFEMGPSASTDITYAGLTGNWVSLVMVYDQANLVTYINGSKSTIAKSGAIIMNDYNLSIGYSPESSARDFNGSIDEVVIWNRALSDSEVQALLKRQTG